MSTTAAPHNEDSIALWTLRGLISAHKKATLVVAGLCVLMAGTLALVALGGGPARALNDSATCTQWGNANQNRQTAYAHLYLSEHGGIPKLGNSTRAVITAINYGCGIAYGDDVADTATVIQAVNGTY